ncbi:hypothetical protein MASR2M17_23580 [Aminivibrio sp.]
MERETHGTTAPGMGRAMELAERGRGLTAPNPCVGAVLVRDGEVVAEGWHGLGQGPRRGRGPARRRQGRGPAGCALYVTLEPCNHQGKTPPCTRAILEAGVPEVVVGCADTTPPSKAAAPRLCAAGA